MTKEASSKTVSSKTIDNKVFEVEPMIVKGMQTMQSFTDTNTSAIPLPSIHGHQLARIIEYYKQNFLFREANDNVVGTSNANDFEFMKDLSLDELKELYLVTNYLNVKELHDLLAQTIADRIKGKSVEFMWKFFGIVNDLTPEEEARIHEENAWAYEGVDDGQD